MRIEAVNEMTCIVYFGDTISEQTAQKVSWAIGRLRQKLSDQIIDIIPSYTSILVSYDVNKTDRFTIIAQLKKALRGIKSTHTNTQASNVIDLPVYYGEEVSLDIEEVCEHNGLGRDQVIQIHSEKLYQVYAIGFSPGFAYLGTTDERIATPRKSTPRLKVPTGSVGIADNQTAIYPSPTPGGWQIIGRTPTKMIDWESDGLAKVAVGDYVRFRSVSKPEFLELGGSFDEL
ncbi:5-oxoprolinase subunit PxpB [Vibrio nigripulchritudo]|uniref:5-oxoprolinase subunit PxpB n=1 Tax=Vibrio nigripulchritudo TaxID=28173 RepID=UPI0003B1F569|nr:5-oxoprolinase subunit PxpB [Vibrio nigripulchritudo]CCN72707.1 putative Allophanate hydrolase subunit 1 [Vibrio nigripulchritudo SFn118]